MFVLLQGLAGGSLSGKSSLVHRYLTGFCPRDEVLSGRHKKSISLDGQKYLLLVRDETGPPDAQVGLFLLMLRTEASKVKHVSSKFGRKVIRQYFFTESAMEAKEL